MIKTTPFKDKRDIHAAISKITQKAAYSTEEDRDFVIVMLTAWEDGRSSYNFGSRMSQVQILSSRFL